MKSKDLPLPVVTDEDYEAKESSEGPSPYLIKQLLLNKPISAPVFNEVAIRLQRLSEKTHYKLEDALKLINSDPNLSAEMLRHANSSFNIGLEPITTIRAAVVRLGSKQIVNLAFTASMSSHKSDNKLINKYLIGCWKHSHSVAIASAWLAMTLKHEKKIKIELMEDEVYLAGLFHSIGTLCILKDLDVLNSTKVVSATDENIKEFIDALYIPVGVRVLEHWGLPKQYSEIIEGLDLGQRWLTSKYANTVAIIRMCSKINTSFYSDIFGKKDELEWVSQELEFLGLEEGNNLIEMLKQLNES